MIRASLSLSLLAVTALTSACVSAAETQKRMQASSDQWRGASVDLLSQTWGPPTSTMPMSGGGSVLSYERDTLQSTTTTTRQPSYAPGNVSGSPGTERTENKVEQLHCTVLFFVAVDGKTIERTETRGAPSACAQIMRPRPDGYTGTTQDGYQTSGDTRTWNEGGTTVSQNMSTMPLAPRATPSAPLAGKWRFVRKDCWQGTATQFGRLTMDGSARSLEYTLDFDARRADSRTGSCLQHAVLTITPRDGRYAVHFADSTTEGCSPLPVFDRVMEIDESGVLVDYDFGTAEAQAQFCASGRMVQIFRRE